MSQTTAHKLRIKFYLSITSTKGKTNKKSRRHIACNELSTTYYGFCNEAFCYLVGSKKHNHTCLIDHIKMMK